MFRHERSDPRFADVAQSSHNMETLYSAFRLIKLCSAHMDPIHSIVVVNGFIVDISPKPQLGGCRSSIICVVFERPNRHCVDDLVRFVTEIVARIYFSDSSFILPQLGEMGIS